MRGGLWIYRVFLTPEGDCNGLYVSSKSPTGFEVRELKGGTSSLGFSYRVVAKRKDIPGARLERVPMPARVERPPPPARPSVATPPDAAEPPERPSR